MVKYVFLVPIEPILTVFQNLNFFRKIFIFHDFGWSLMKISKKKIFQYFQYPFVGRLWVHIRVQIWNIILIGQSKAKKHPFFGFFRNFENSNRLVKFHKNWVKIMKWVFLMLIPSIWNVFAKLNFFSRNLISGIWQMLKLVRYQIPDFQFQA